MFQKGGIFRCRVHDIVEYVNLQLADSMDEIPLPRQRSILESRGIPSKVYGFNLSTTLLFEDLSFHIVYTGFRDRFLDLRSDRPLSITFFGRFGQ